jgi:hypothetical protein
VNTAPLLTLTFGELPGEIELPPAACGVDIFDTAALWLTSQLQAHASRPIVYVRGPNQLALCATPGRSEAATLDFGEAFRVTYTDRDYLIPADRLRIGGAATLPRAGDLIREEIAGELHEFEVMAEAGIPPWRYSDPHHRLLRIHTKQIAGLSV